MIRLAKKGAGGEGAAGKKSGKMKLLIILGIILVLAAGAGAAAAKIFIFKKPTPEKNGALTAEAYSEKLEKLELDSIIVNLADRDANHYLRITVVLAFAGGEGAKRELDEKKFEFRDRIIRLLRQKHYAEVIAPDYTERLKKEILAVINQNGGGAGKIRDIYITEYLVQ